jgi:hypothetical protein
VGRKPAGRHVEGHHTGRENRWPSTECGGHHGDVIKSSLSAHLPVAEPVRAARQQRVAVGPAIHPPAP